MNPTPNRPPVRIATPASLLAVIPYLLGFTPHSSLVVIGSQPETSRIQITLRYDLPDPPDPGIAAEVADHAVGVMNREHALSVVVAGYGPGRLVTPLADTFRRVMPEAGLVLRDVLRVEDGRFWSYLCTDPSCCPADGVPFDSESHPAARILAGAGQPALASREALAASIAAVTGAEAVAMAEATGHAERIAARLITGRGPAGLDRSGLSAVRAAIGVYRDGGSVGPSVGHAWLALVLLRLRIRDDAWARMDPAHHQAHQRLWTDVTRRAQPGYIAAPASLLALTAWQAGDGALANIAIERALADTPGYSMAILLRDAIAAGAPPSAARPPMTPEQVAEAYATLPSPQAPSSTERMPPTTPGTSAGGT